MSHSRESTEALVQVLLQKKPSKIVSRGKELVRRCPYCGDSKNTSHHHFYIGLMQPYPFYCQICKSDGYLTKAVLRDLDSDQNYDVVIHVEKSLKDFFKDRKTTNRRSISQNLFRREFLNPVIDLEDLSKGEERRLNYLIKRLDLNRDELDNTFINSLNLSLSLKSFLNLNEIEFFTEKDIELVKRLATDYLGYASRTGQSIYMRDVTGNHQRHWQYNVVHNTKSVDNFYVISKEFDVTSSRPTIHLAEGFFSLLGVYELLGRPNDSDIMFASPIGKAFNRIIYYLSNIGILDFDINYYADSDVNLDFFRRLMSSNKILRYNKGVVKVLYNTLEDDFGHPVNKIKIRETTL